MFDKRRKNIHNAENIKHPIVNCEIDIIATIIIFF